uniref:TnpA5 n=1 Tax=Comamonas testosteroni TaxID=285 RepID=G9C9F5_COMTE|nr:TnpA5 [Comamonas testosteroni]
MRSIRGRDLRVCLLEKVMPRAHARARHDGGHARRPGHPHDRCAGRTGFDAGAARCDRAHARRAEVQANQDRGAELRDRAAEALALRLLQREPGDEHAGGAVRSDPGRHGAGRPRRPARPEATGSATPGQRPGGAPGAAGEPAAHRSPSRDRADPLRVRPALQAHRPRSQRAARLRAGPILRAAPYPRQVRLHVLPDDPGRADARADHRQRHPRAGPARAGGGGQARRSLAAVPAGRDLRALWRAHPALEHGPVDRHLRGASGTAGRCTEGLHPQPRCDPRRRDAGVAAGAGARQDQTGLRLGLPHDQLRGPARGAVRLHRQPRRRTSAARAARLRRHAGQRRLQRLFWASGARRQRRTMLGPRAAQAVRGARVQRQPDRRPGGGADRKAVRGRARGARTRTPGTVAAAPATLQAHRPGPAPLADRAAPEAGQCRRDGQGDRLFAEQLARAHALPGRRRRPNRQQRGGERGAPAVRWPQELAFCRLAAGRRARWRGHEPDRVGQTKRARSLGLPQGRLRASAHAQAARPRAAAAAQLAACHRHRRAKRGARRRRVEPSFNTPSSTAQGCRSRNAYGVPAAPAQLLPVRIEPNLATVPQREGGLIEVQIHGVDLFSLSKVTVGDRALA